jgi:hypothetical protein
MMRLRSLCVMFALFALCSAAVAGSAAAQVRNALPSSVLAGATVRIDGRVSRGTAATSIELQVSRGGRWSTAARAHAKGRFHLSWVVRGGAGRVRIRLVVQHGKGKIAGPRQAVVLVHGRRRTGHVAHLGKHPAGASTLVVKPNQIASAPTPGTSGRAVLSGIYGVSPGQVLAAGTGSNSPDGLLVLVDAVSREGAHTVLQTEPATLPQALPAGEIDQTFTAPASLDATASARAHSASAISCGGQPLDLKASVDITPTISLHASWSLFGGLKSASFSVGGRATTSVKVTDNALQLSCKAKADLLNRPLAPIDFQVGPIPVVVVPDLKLVGEVSGSIGGSVSTGVSGTVSLSGGATYANGHLSPTGSAGLAFNAISPTFSLGGSLGAHVVPTLQLLFYGVGGPSLELTTGLDFDANLLSTPVWTLTAPLNLDASFSIPVFGLNIPGKVHISDHRFLLASGGTGAPVTPPPPPQPPVEPAGARHIASYTPGADLACTLRTAEDTTDEFFGGGIPNDACGTFLAYGGELYGPSEIPAGGGLGSYTPWTPVSQSTTGSGTNAAPYATTTVVEAGGTGVRLAELDTWTSTGYTVNSNYVVTAPPGDTSGVVLYHAADCYVGESDFGTGSLTDSSQIVGCVHESEDGSLLQAQFTPLTPGAASVETFYDFLWQDIATQEPLPQSCDCGELEDNSAGISWPFSLAGTSPITHSSRLALIAGS